MGRGSKSRRSGDAFQLKIELPRNAEGGRQYKYATVHGSSRDADKVLTKLVHEVNAGTFFEPAKISLAAFLDQWLDTVGDNLAATSRQRYRQVIDRHLKPGLGHHRLDQLAPIHVQTYYTNSLRSGRLRGGGPLSAATVRKAHQVLHRALRDAVRWRMIGSNVTDAVDPPRVRRSEMRALTGPETAQLLAAAEGDRMFAPVLTAVSTGLRRGELLGLRWRDLDLEAGMLTVQQALEETKEGVGFKAPKTRRSRRSLPIGPTTVAALRRHRAAQDEQRLLLGAAYSDHDLVFAQPDGRPWSPYAFSMAFRRLVRRSGLPHTRLHDLRHSHATALLSQGVNVKVVSERLGHASVAITLDCYAHTVPTMQEEAVAAFDAELQRALAAAASRPAVAAV